MNPAALPLYLFSFFLILSVMVPFPVLPEIRSAVGASYSEISLFVATLGVVRLVLAYPSGLLVDRLDKKKVLVFSGILAAGGLVLTGTAHHMAQLVAGRAVIAAASILSNVTVLVLLVGLAGPGRRGAVLSMNNVAHNAGGIVAPVLAGLLARRWTWRTPFFGVAGLVLVGTILVWITFPRAAPRRRSPPAAPPAEAGTGAPRARWDLVVHLAPLFAVSLFVFYYRSSFRHTLLPLFANDVLGLGVDTTGFYLGLVGAVSMTSILGAGFVADRWGRKAVLVPSLLLAVSSGLALLLPAGAHPFALACVLTGLAGAINTMPNVLISDRVAAASLGRALGVNRIFADFGYFLGSMSVGFLLDRAGFGAPVGVVVGLALATLLLVVLRVREPER